MRKLLPILSCFIAFSSFSALACTYAIDEVAKSKELESVAIAAVKSGSAEIEIEEKEELSFSYFESKPTPMCPEEMTYNAEYQIRYSVKGPNRYSSKCVGTVKVTKVEPWNSDPELVYKVSGARLFRCTR